MTSPLPFDPLILAPRTGAGGLAPKLSLVLPTPRRVDPVALEIASRSARRVKIWELSSQAHCSIIGTCLSTSELRQVLAKTGLAVERATDHDLHSKGVALAGRHDSKGKLLHKALDRRHRLAIGRYDKAKTADEVLVFWEADLKNGDIPGAYWAALTHPATTDALFRAVFGEVHMLSHLVGAANRADIRRLRELEAENAGLQEKLGRQQDRLHEAITSRDAKIRDLSAVLARQIADGTQGRQAGESDAAALAELVAGLERRLRSETNRREAIEERLKRTTDELDRERARGNAAEQASRALTLELEAIEANLITSSRGDEDQAPSGSLCGVTVLYVGGRPDKLVHLRNAGERLGVKLLHHDGGVEDRAGLLGGSVSRADIVMFPVDCVSHEAVTTAKRLCRQMAKPYLPLRSTGMGSFVAALADPIVASLTSRRMS